MLKDKDIREPLFDYLECEYGKTRIIEEKMMGSSRADVIMVITGALVGIEIKSDADTYTRLESQIKDYDKYFDYNIVVVGSSHANHVGEHIPEHWGIITVDEVENQCDFYFLRRPELNKKMRLNRKLELLWRPELAALQEMYNMPKYNGKSKAFVRKALLERVPGAILWPQAMEELFERDYNTIDEEIEASRSSGQKKSMIQ